MACSRSFLQIVVSIFVIALIDCCYSFTINKSVQNSVNICGKSFNTVSSLTKPTATTTIRLNNAATDSSTNNIGPRPIHKEFTVEKATSEQLQQLDVMKWPTWSTSTSPKYKVGIKSPLKVYDCNELSYVTKGTIDIIDAKTGIASTVTVGDFVTFPNGYECYWFVKETITKHWYIY